MTNSFNKGDIVINKHYPSLWYEIVDNAEPLGNSQIPLTRVELNKEDYVLLCKSENKEL